MPSGIKETLATFCSRLCLGNTTLDEEIQPLIISVDDRAGLQESFATQFDQIARSILEAPFDQTFKVYNAEITINNTLFHICGTAQGQLYVYDENNLHDAAWTSITFHQLKEKLLQDKELMARLYPDSEAITVQLQQDISDTVKDTITANSSRDGYTAKIWQPTETAILSKVPGLKEDIRQLYQQGWMICTNPYGGTYSCADSKSIVIDNVGMTDELKMISDLAHEVGHAKDLRPIDGSSQENYINSNLLSEGAAVLNELRSWYELFIRRIFRINQLITIEKMTYF
ncbi:MAG: hypothetical protein ACRC5A_15365 [Enterobacteriaceae bacterium]